MGMDVQETMMYGLQTIWRLFAPTALVLVTVLLYLWRRRADAQMMLIGEGVAYVTTLVSTVLYAVFMWSHTFGWPSIAMTILNVIGTLGRLAFIVGLFMLALNLRGKQDEAEPTAGA